MAPPGPDSLVPRTDAGARKIIEHLHEVVREVSDKLDGRIKATDEDLLELRKSVNRRMKAKVSYFALLTILGSSALTMLTFSVNAANSTRKEMFEARQQLAEDVRQVRSEQAGKIQGLEAKADGVYQYLIEGKPRAAVIQEVKASLKTIPKDEKPKEK
jgi:hypothetical protein